MVLLLNTKVLPVTVQSRISGRSRSSFYYKRKQPTKDALFFEQVRALHQKYPWYGYRRITDELQKTGLKLTHRRTYRMMRKHGFRARTSRRVRSKNQYSTPKTSLPNLLTNMTIERPNQVWAADFTHFTWHRRTYYLAVVMDIYTRQIVGWHVAPSHTVHLVLEAMRMALCRRPKAPQILHSDHGSEYISEEFNAMLKEHGIEHSHAGKGKPWQNGFVESWNYRFKEEFGDPNRFEIFDKLFEGLCNKFAEYNGVRTHSKLRMSPDAFCAKKMLELGGAEGCLQAV